MKRKLTPILLSDLYWFMSINLALLLAILYYVDGKKIVTILLACIMMVISLFIQFDKKLQDSLNYEKEVHKWTMKKA